MLALAEVCRCGYVSGLATWFCTPYLREFCSWSGPLVFKVGILAFHMHLERGGDFNQPDWNIRVSSETFLGIRCSFQPERCSDLLYACSDYPPPQVRPTAQQPGPVPLRTQVALRDGGGSTNDMNDWVSTKVQAGCFAGRRHAGRVAWEVDWQRRFHPLRVLRDADCIRRPVGPVRRPIGFRWETDGHVSLLPRVCSLPTLSDSRGVTDRICAFSVCLCA